VNIKNHEFPPTQADEFVLLDLRDPANCRKALTFFEGGMFDEVCQLAADMGGTGFISVAECEVLHNNVLINLHTAHTAAEMGVRRSSTARAPAGARPYDYRMRQGSALEQLKDWAGAEAAYRRAVEARLDLFWPYLSVGHMRRAQEDYDGALAWYRKAESLAPDQFEPKFWVGLAQYLRKDDQAAEEAFRTALEMNPQHAWGAYYLAQSLYRQGHRKEAVSWLRTAIGLYKGQLWNWAVQLGDWLAEAGDWEGALDP